MKNGFHTIFESIHSLGFKSLLSEMVLSEIAITRKNLNYFITLSYLVVLSTSALATAYTKCSGPQAINEDGSRRPDFDEICKLPTAIELLPQYAYTNRCPIADENYCAGTGTPTLVKPRDIPGGGVYWYTVAGIGDMMSIRCVCGCFIGSTEILTNYGWQAIDRAVANSNRVSIAVILPEIGKKAFSATRRGKDFVKGPEEIPVLRITTQDGKSLTLTEKHPMLVSAGGVKKMIQAKALKLGDRLFTFEGELTNVISIISTKLPKDDNFVYNLHTGNSSGPGGIIAANGLRVGDLTWQLRLSERESREENLIQKKNVDISNTEKK